MENSLFGDMVFPHRSNGPPDTALSMTVCGLGLLFLASFFFIAIFKIDYSTDPIAGYQICTLPLLIMSMIFYGLSFFCLYAGLETRMEDGRWDLDYWEWKLENAEDGSERRAIRKLINNLKGS